MVNASKTDPRNNTNKKGRAGASDDIAQPAAAAGGADRILQFRLHEGFDLFGSQLLAGVHEQVLLEQVLLVVKLFVAAAVRDEFGVVSAFDDLAGLNNKYLVGAADGR